jgi:uncharacterized membrane protein required for colicin V production
MSFSDIIEYLRLVNSKLPFRLFDLIFLVSFMVYVWEESVFGTVTAFFHLIAIVCSFLLSLILYPFLSTLLVKILPLTKGFADAIAFIIIAGIIYGILTFLKSRYGHKVTPQLPPIADRLGGIFFGALSYLVLVLFFVALILSFPVSSVIKKEIQTSLSGRFLLIRSHVLESSIRSVFGGAIEDTLSFITIKPDSNETIALRFHTQNYKRDIAAENRMFEMVNQERAKRGLPLLTQAPNLADVGRAHAADMLERGYFSHNTPEGLSPFDRIDNAGISYTFAAENLAFAPDVENTTAASACRS